ncbi:MAG: hypothetical protein AABY22_19935 [Nanoarchaeota archaeon]
MNNDNNCYEIGNLKSNYRGKLKICKSAFILKFDSKQAADYVRKLLIKISSSDGELPMIKNLREHLIEIEQI